MTDALLPATCWICRQRPAAVSLAALPASLCAHCAELTEPCDRSWAVLLTYLRAHWKDIVARGSFDLSRAFGGDAASGALLAHLYCVKLLGSKLSADRIAVDLSGFASALNQRQPHPEVTLLIAHCATGPSKLLYYDAEVSVLRRDDEVYSAMWMSLYFPVAVKTCYLKRSAPVLEPDGFPWHPTRQRKVVKLSPYKGDTRPVHARRDLRL